MTEAKSQGRKVAKPDSPEQFAAFIKKAREIEADEEHSAADLLLGRLAKMKPEPRKKKSGDTDAQ